MHFIPPVMCTIQPAQPWGAFYIFLLIIDIFWGYILNENLLN